MDSSKKIALSATMWIISVVLLISGINVKSSSDYKFYKNHYEECEDLFMDCMDAIQSASIYTDISSYKSIADSALKMMKDDEKEIKKHETKANIMYAFFCIFMVAGFCILVVKSKDDYKMGLADNDHDNGSGTCEMQEVTAITEDKKDLLEEKEVAEDSAEGDS